MDTRLRWLLPLLAALGTWAAPLELSTAAHRMAALMVGTVGFWLLQPIPLAATALLAPALATIAGLGSERAILSAFADPVIFLFLGGFLIARAMEKHGCDTHLARTLLQWRVVRGHTGGTLVALVAITAFLSMWLSNTATALIMLPIATGLLPRLFPASDSSKPHSATLLTIAYAASIGGIGTPVGSPPNAIAIGLLDQVAGIQVGFLGWMRVAVPIQAILLAALVWRLRLHLGPESWSRRYTADTQTLPSLTPAQRATYFWACAAAALWLLPEAIALSPLAPEWSVWLKAHLPESTVALLISGGLFLWPLHSPSKLLSWQDAAGIDWGTLLLFGGGLSLGALLFETGLGNVLGGWLPTARPNGWGLLWFLVCLIGLTVTLTEVASNTAIANLFLPIAIAATAATGQDPMVPVIGTAIACSLAFCLPVATPPNAILYGTKQVPLEAMARAGVVMNVIAAATTVATLFIWTWF